MGDGVNIAARLEGIAAPARSACPRRLPAGERQARHGLSPTRPTQLKNIERSIRVYRCKWASRQAEPAEAVKPAPPTPRHGGSGSRRSPRVRGAAGCGRGRRVVVPQCEPDRDHRLECAGAAGASFHCGASFANLSGDPRRYYSPTDHENLTTSCLASRPVS